MSKRETMPAMMACRTEPMPLTIAIRQAPMVWKTDLICERGSVSGGLGLRRWVVVIARPELCCCLEWDLKNGVNTTPSRARSWPGTINRG